MTLRLNKLHLEGEGMNSLDYMTLMILILWTSYEAHHELCQEAML